MSDVFVSFLFLILPLRALAGQESVPRHVSREFQTRDFEGDAAGGNRILSRLNTARALGLGTLFVKYLPEDAKESGENPVLIENGFSLRVGSIFLVRPWGPSQVVTSVTRNTAGEVKFRTPMYDGVFDASGNLTLNRIVSSSTLSPVGISLRTPAKGAHHLDAIFMHSEDDQLRIVFAQAPKKGTPFQERTVLIWVKDPYGEWGSMVGYISKMDESKHPVPIEVTVPVSFSNRVIFKMSLDEEARRVILHSDSLSVLFRRVRGEEKPEPIELSQGDDLKPFSYSDESLAEEFKLVQ